MEEIWYHEKCDVMSQRKAIKNNKKIIYSPNTGRGVFIVEDFEEATFLKKRLSDINIKIKGSRSHSLVDGKIVIHFYNVDILYKDNINKPTCLYYDRNKPISWLVEEIYTNKIEKSFKNKVLNLNVVRSSYAGGGVTRYFLEEKLNVIIDGELFEIINKYLLKYIEKNFETKKIMYGNILDYIIIDTIFERIVEIDKVSKTNFSQLKYGEGRHHRNGHILDKRFLVTENNLSKYNLK